MRTVTAAALAHRLEAAGHMHAARNAPAYIRQWERQGVLERVGRGRYVPTPAGAQVLASVKNVDGVR